MNNHNYYQENHTLRVFGAGMLFYLALLSFLHLLVLLLFKYLMIISSIEPLVNFWINNFIYLGLYSYLIIKVFCLIKENSTNNYFINRVLKISLIALFTTQILQFLVASYFFDFILKNYSIELENYQNVTNSGYLLMVEAGFEFLCYVVLGILIYKK